MEGKVQVCLVNTWNAVCGRLSPQEQNVLCREMGYLRNQSSSSKEVLLEYTIICLHFQVWGREERHGYLHCMTSEINSKSISETIVEKMTSSSTCMSIFTTARAQCLRLNMKILI